MILNNIETERGTFTDIVDNQGNIIETAEEFYQRWLNKIDICPEPDEIYILSEQVLELEARNLLQEETQEELTNYVLELDTRVTTIETL